MGKPERSLVMRRPNVQGRHKHTHKCSYAFLRRRGAWASLNGPLITRRPNVQERHKHTHKMLVRLYEEERCMGKPERSLVTRRPNVQERHKHTHKMLVRLYEEERCMGKPERSPRHKTTERTRKTQTHKQRRTNKARVHEHRKRALRVPTRRRRARGDEGMKGYEMKRSGRRR